MKSYNNITLYTGNDFTKWAAFTARFSRSPLPPLELWKKEFESSTIISESTAVSTKTKEFLDRVVSDYGDNSVMEMTPICFFVEKISILLGVVFTDPAFGWSPMERSTRRQKMVPPSKTTPEWEAYLANYDKTYNTLKEKNTNSTTIRDDTCDAVRDGVPLDAHTVIGITCNVRSFVNFYHDLNWYKFASFGDNHPVYDEIENIKKNLKAMFLDNYDPFRRKIDIDHDTSIRYEGIQRTTFRNFAGKPHTCLSLAVAAPEFTTSSPAPMGSFQTKFGRKNRHGALPPYFNSILIQGNVLSTFSIYREFKRHRTITCFDVCVDSDGAFVLGLRTFWRFTASLGHLMQMMELRTEEKSHPDIRALCESILVKLKEKLEGFETLKETFFFVFNQ